MKTKEREIRIKEHLEGIYNLSTVTDKTQEPYFSHTPCECCGSGLGGDRYDFVGKLGRKHTDEIIELSCCVDCYTYLFA